MRNVQSARVKQLERIFNFLPVLRAESCTLQTDDVNSENGIAFCGDRERRQIFAKCGTPLNHHQPPYVHVLVKCRSSTEKCLIVYEHVSGQQTIVGNDHVVIDLAIVTNVNANHEKIVVADLRRAAFGTATMDRAILANHVLIADLDLRFSFKRK